MVWNTLEMNKCLAFEFLKHTWGHVRHTILKLFFWRCPSDRLSDAHEIFGEFMSWVLKCLKVACGNHQSFLIILSTISKCKTRTSSLLCTTIQMKSNQTHQLQFLPTHQWPSHLQPCRSTQLHQHNFETSNNQFLMMMTSAIIIGWIIKKTQLS